MSSSPIGNHYVQVTAPFQNTQGISQIAVVGGNHIQKLSDKS